MLICVERVVVRRGQELSRDIRHFVSSLDPAKVTPSQVLGWVRGHWSIENNLHFVKDRWWDEDRHWLRRPGLAERYATLTSCAMSLLHLMTAATRHSLRSQADQFCWNPKALLKATGFQK